MNKTQLIDTVTDKTGQTKTLTARILNVLLATLEESLASGEAVQLFGFGSFSAKERAARQARNPQTDGLARQENRPVQARQGVGGCVQPE
jgi:DNA-binding protein HU-beta